MATKALTFVRDNATGAYRVGGGEVSTVPFTGCSHGGAHNGHYIGNAAGEKCRVTNATSPELMNEPCSDFDALP